jgi:hypothetical protein
LLLFAFKGLQNFRNHISGSIQNPKRGPLYWRKTGSKACWKSLPHLGEDAAKQQAAKPNPHMLGLMLFWTVVFVAPLMVESMRRVHISLIFSKIAILTEGYSIA